MITAKELVDKQEEVEYLQKSQQIAFDAIAKAKDAVKKAEINYNDEQWRAEEAFEELKEMREKIKAGE